MHASQLCFLNNAGLLADYTLLLVLCVSIGVFGVIVLIVAGLVIASRCKTMRCCSCCCFQRNRDEDRRRLSISSYNPPPPYPEYYDETGRPIPFQVVEPNSPTGADGHSGGSILSLSNSIGKTAPTQGAPSYVSRSISEPHRLEIPVPVVLTGRGNNTDSLIGYSTSVSEGGQTCSSGGVVVVCPSTPTTHFELPSNLPILSLMDMDDRPVDQHQTDASNQPARMRLLLRAIVD